MKTIAIIDDDIHIGDMLSEVLSQEGYAVLRAYSGTEALYLLSHDSIQLEERNDKSVITIKSIELADKNIPAE